MTLSQFSIRRKIAMTCIILMLAILGVFAYSKIGIDLLPKFDVPYVQVTAIYPGASPEEIEVDVARRIEDAIASLEGLKHITTVCMENAAALTLEFELGTDVDVMIHQVREKINTIMDDFPDAVETPQLSKININAIPVVTLYLTGTRTLDEMYDYVDDKLSDVFSSIPGVGEVRIHGGNEVQLHIILNREKMAAANLTVAEVLQKVARNNVKLPVGRVREGGREISLTYNAEFQDPEDIKALEVGNLTGKRLYLGDIADVQLISKEIRQEGYFGGELGVCIEIVKRSDANAVKVIDAIRAKYDSLTTKGGLPGGMHLEWFKDTGSFIRASVADSWQSVILGIALTAILLFLFLHEVRPTLIISVTMPVSVVITFAAMDLMHYTFDMMTLVAIGCSAGILVANSVVVIENIIKKQHEGLSPADAASRGTDEVLVAVAASALTNVVVFVPVALMKSVVGLLIAPFAGVMVIATVVSLFVSFTLTPLLSSVLLRDSKGPMAWQKALFWLWDKVYDLITAAYGHTLDVIRRHSGVVIILILVGCALILRAVLPGVSMSFVPENDKGEISITLEYPANYDLAETRARTFEIIRDVNALPWVVKTGTTIGYRNVMLGQVPEGVNLAEITIMGLQKSQRAPIEDLVAQIHELLDTKYENLLYSITIPRATGVSGVEMTAFISGDDFDKLEEYAKRGAAILRESGMAEDIDTSVRTRKPKIVLKPNRTVIKDLGIDAATLGTSLVGYYEGVESGTFKVGSRSYEIRVKTEDVPGFDQASNIVAGSVRGKPIDLDVVASLEADPVSIALMREDKMRGGWIYANAAPGYTLDDIMKLLETKLTAELDQGYELKFFGQAEMMREGADEFVSVFVIAIVMTYLLIAALLESWFRPVIIMFTVPLGFIGLLLILSLTGTSLSMIGLLGAVMMIGIVVNNAILILDETRMLELSGMTTHDAMTQAAKNKFRPVVMTSIASIAGMLPMAFGRGLGSELRSSCGLGVVGGLVFSSVLTIYLIPALYYKFIYDTALPNATVGRRIMCFFGFRPKA
ncbi:MAG: efflux RND transporter permease subunit [Lentisphaeria bacterium]|nr:efflux RND transporter permease subunit [Lentisphaeria bacterium]